MKLSSLSFRADVSLVHPAPDVVGVWRFKHTHRIRA